MLITVVFCIGDMQADAETPTGFPFIAIFAEALGSIPAGAGLVSPPKNIITVYSDESTTKLTKMKTHRQPFS